VCLLLAVLGAAGCGRGARAEAQPAPDPRCQQPPPDETGALAAAGIDRTTFLASMAQARPAVRECLDEYKRRGVAQVRVEVGPSGLVERATVCSELGGTREGRCIEHGIKKAVRFPELKAPLAFDYPYQLR
jgi:hypothetical protein